jgi:Tol biopolymer transport system component/predicted Ser/Thr protein kinase
MSLAAGSRLGPYEILTPIGAGGMGEVYKARDTRLDRIVAIKVAKEQFSERFEREARAVAALNHPHICHLYDVGPNYLVMELVEGTPLKGPLPLNKAIEYAGQILDALDAAHKKGITHRDLKPANILVTRQGIKLLDFGLAKQTAPLQETDVTRALTGKGQILGTLQYMSPEQLQGKEVDARSDLFSFGCVLYEMLTGKRAFGGESPASVIAAILEREPAPLEVARPLDRVVRRSLAKDPDQRFQTARDLKAALSWVLEQPPAPAAESIRRWWVATAAAMLVLGAAGGWAVSHFRQQPPDERSFRLQINPPEGGRFVFGDTIGGGIALSPDGKTAAYIASSRGKNGLWVRALDGTTARLLLGTEDAAHPFWSPDNKSIAFFAAGKLQRVDLAGGPPLTMCDAANERGGAWSSEGQIVFSAATTGLFHVPASGGTPTPLTTLDAAHGETGHRWPQVLPGGRFLYLAQGDNPENTGIYVASLVKPAERVRLLTTDTKALYAPGIKKSYLLWLRDGTLFAQEFDSSTLKPSGEPRLVADSVAMSRPAGQMNVAVSATGLLLYGASNSSSQFTWLDRAGKSLALVGEPGEYDTFRLSLDGRRAAASRARPNGRDLWLLEMERGLSSRLTPNSSGNTLHNLYPVWSPDGRTILYTAGGSVNLFRRESSGVGSEQRLTRSPNYQFATDWSHDGRFVLYHEVDPGTQRDLWVLPVTPEGRPTDKPIPYLHTPYNEWLGRFSSEASPRWVAYQSDESGRNEVYIQSFPEPHGATRISTGGGRYPEWSASGRELFYVSPDFRLMAVSLKLTADSVLPSAPRELFSLPVDDIGYSPYEVAPDGQRFMVRATAEKAAAQPLTVIVNWPALLKKGATR